MLIEIITIGDELLSGNVLDTNTQFLSDHLFRHGFMVEYHTGLRDDETKMVTAFETASDRADIVLVTGGLGFIGSNFIRYILKKYQGEQCQDIPNGQESNIKKRLSTQKEEKFLNTQIWRVLV